MAKKKGYWKFCDWVRDQQIISLREISKKMEMTGLVQYQYGQAYKVRNY